MKPTLFFSFLLSLLIHLPLSAQGQTLKLITQSTSLIPQKLSYQGVLTDSAGVPKNGTFPMTFDLYTASTGGISAWTEPQNVQVTNGIFNVLLGSINPLNSSSFSVAYWLGVQVQGSALSPRIELAASAYSFWAVHADTAQIAQSANTALTAQSANSMPSTASLAIRYLSAYNDQGSSAGSFSLDNASSTNKALEVHNFGHGNALYVEAHSDGDALNAKADGSGRAGYFQGNVQITGTLSKGGGSFEIDHPLDPANMILRHSFVESPDMMNMYNGNIVTDSEGLATILLPTYFEALNRDFRYQLTVVGQFAQVIVSDEIRNNRFSIQTEKPNVKVSWQVTGIRRDAWAEKNRIVVEQPKSPETQGSYLHPDAFGKSIERPKHSGFVKPLKDSSTEIESEKE